MWKRSEKVNPFAKCCSIRLGLTESAELWHFAWIVPSFWKGSTPKSWEFKLSQGPHHICRTSQLRKSGRCCYTSLSRFTACNFKPAASQHSVRGFLFVLTVFTHSKGMNWSYFTKLIKLPDSKNEWPLIGRCDFLFYWRTRQRGSLFTCLSSPHKQMPAVGPIKQGFVTSQWKSFECEGWGGGNSRGINTGLGAHIFS